jgi:hypothetical protein
MWQYRRPRPDPAWRRSSYCANGECLEIKPQGGKIFLRNSRDWRGRTLRYTTEEWQSFVRGVKAGEFDDIG